MNINKIPVTSLPNQSAKVEIKIDDKQQTFFINLSFKEVCNYWVLDLKDQYQNILLSNIPLITGGGLLEAGNLLKQYGYRNLGCILVLKEKSEKSDYPNSRNLGESFSIYWGDTKVSDL